MTAVGVFPRCQPAGNARSLDGVDLTPTTPVATTRRRRSVNRIWPPRTRAAAIVTLGFTMLLYLIELVDASVFHQRLDQAGIQPREVDGLDGVLFAPLLHAGWAHLEANTVPVLLFGFLAMAAGLRQWIAVTATIWLLGGLGVWLTGTSGSVTIGASGLAFGWLTFLLFRGLFNRSPLQIGLAVLLLFFWGGLLWGVLPGQPGISWQGHLFGAVAGILAAWLAAKANPRRAIATG
jgi:membrane associated rhomboid family serine protease